MHTITLRGKVTTGQGGGTRFINLPWVQKQITKKLGFKPFLGTLNIRLNAESVKAKNELVHSGKAIWIDPVKGFCCGLGFRARIMDKIDGAVIIPQVQGYPEDLLEVIAPLHLRTTLRLREGDEVRLTVYPPQ